MRLSTPASLLLLLATSGEESSAFAPPTRNARRFGAARRLLRASGPGAGGAPKKVLTADDVMAKSRSKGDPAAPGQQDVPKIFSPAVYDDFQSSLLLLEKRVKGGPGSLSGEEVSRLEEETARIVKEMREFMADPEGMAESIHRVYEGGDAAVVDAASKNHYAVANAPPAQPIAPATKVDAPPPPAVDAAPAAGAPTAPTENASPEEVAAPPSPAVDTAPAASARAPAAPTEDVPPEETDDSDAAKGYGLARGTTNTYIIPGMEEMSGEEYRAKLQETISARQAQRRKSSLSDNKGIIGNASSQGYLDSLGGNNQGENNSSFDVGVKSGGRQPFGGRNGEWGSHGGEGEGGSRGEGETNDGNTVGSYPRHLQRQGEQPAANEEQETDDENTVSSGQRHSQPWVEQQAASQEPSDETVEVPVDKERVGSGDMDATAPVASIDDAEDVPTEVEDKQQNSDMGADTSMASMDDDQSDGQPIDGIEDRVEQDEPQEESTAEAIEDSLAKQSASPILMMRQSIIEQEQRRQSEWQHHEGEGHGNFGEDGNNRTIKKPKFGGRFKRMQADRGFEASKKVSNESTQSFAHGNVESQRVSTSAKEEGSLPEYFDVHGASLRKSDTVQLEKIAMDREGPGDARNPNNGPESTFEKILALHRGPGGIRSTDAKKMVETAKSLVETQARMRPAAPSEPPEYATFADHRSAGDTRIDHAFRTQNQQSSKSLVETEERIRPVPSSDLPEYVQVKDHRSAGDMKDPKKSQMPASVSPASLVQTERRARPTPSSNLPEYARVKDRRSVGDMKDPKRSRMSESGSPASLAWTEERVRPSPISNQPEYTTVRNHRSVGDMSALTKRDKQQQSSSPGSLILNEERVRPAALSSSKNNPHGYGKARPDHRGPGDTNALTKRAQVTSVPSSGRQSLFDTEQRSALSSSQNNPHGYGKACPDHRDPGDSNAMTKRAKASSASLSGGQSLCDTKQKSALSSSKNNPHGYGKAGPDHRDPGDSNAMTRRAQVPSAPSSGGESLIDSKQRSALSSSKNNPHGYGKAGPDHRDPGDSNATTRKAQVSSASSSGVQSLIDTEQRLRPAPTSSNQLQRSNRVADHRGPGDSNTLTRRAQQRQDKTAGNGSLIDNEESVRPTASSLSKDSPRGYGTAGADHRSPGDSNDTKTRAQVFSSGLASAQSLIDAEKRVRPAPTSSHQSQRSVRVTDHRGPGDNRALTSRGSSSSCSTVTADSLSDEEQRVGPTPVSDQFQNKNLGDFRGVGDTRTLTAKKAPLSLKAGAVRASSLSEEEQRQRPIPSAGGGESLQMSDHRGPGDASTLTRKKIGSSAAVVASLSKDEQRSRPVPSATQFKSASAIQDRTGPATMALTQEGKEPWWNEDTQRRPIDSHRSKNNARVLDRAIDDTLTDRSRPVLSAKQHKSASVIKVRTGLAAMASTQEEKEQWWNEETQRRPIDSQPSKNKARVLDRAIDDTVKESASAEISPSSESKESPSQISSFARESLLKTKKEKLLTSVQAKMSPTLNKVPIATLQTSSLQSLLKKDGDPSKKSSRLSSLLKDDRDKRRSSDTHQTGWWKERPHRPRGYVKHNQPLNTSCVKKHEPPRDYGNVLEA